MSESPNRSRRHFLEAGLFIGGSSLAPSPLVRLVDLLVNGIISKAQAAEAGLALTRNYVNILLPGAPSRYVFDHWLRTGEDDPAIVANVMNGNVLASSNGRAVGTQNSYFKAANGLLVPSFFQNSVAAPGGGTRPLTDLLQNMMVIRGYGSGFDGHTPNVTVQLAPLGGVSSISGVAADYSNKTFQALQYPPRGPWGNYSSSAGKALNVVSSAKPLSELMAGFAPPFGNSASLLKRQQAALDLAATKLKSFSRSGFLGATTIAKTMDDAKKEMQLGIADVESFWQEATARYSAIFTASARADGIPGITDLNLTATGPGDTYYGVHVSEGDHRVIPNGDLSSIRKNFTPPPNLVEGFALAEYVLTNNKVTSLELMLPPDVGGQLVMDHGTYSNATGTGGSTTNFSYHADFHQMGPIPGVVIGSCLYRGLSAVMLELINQLKAKNLWAQTVIQITSDFGRIGRKDGIGSDHGINEMITSVYSGIIKEPMVIGNIWQSGNNPGFSEDTYPGTHGTGAPILEYGTTTMPTPLMPSSIVASLLGVPNNPFQNVARPLVIVDAGVAKPLTKGKILPPDAPAPTPNPKVSG